MAQGTWLGQDDPRPVPLTREPLPRVGGRADGQFAGPTVTPHPKFCRCCRDWEAHPGLRQFSNNLYLFESSADLQSLP